MALPRHKIVLLCGDIRFVQGLVKAGANGNDIAAQLTALLRTYACENGVNETARLKTLLDALEKDLAKRST